MIKALTLNGYGRNVCTKDKERTRLIPNSNMIHFIEDGSGYYNGMLLKKGQGFICFKDKLCDYFPDKSDPWTYSWINITGSGTEDVIKNLPLKNGAFEFDLSLTNDLISKINVNRNPATDEMRCIGILLEIIARISSSEKNEGYVLRAQEFFSRNYHQGITIEDCAKSLNISRAYLRNLFFRETGVSPQKYLMDLKMERAEFLLKTDYPITEIAHAVGYTDVLQFSRIFSKHHGMSPKTYRKEFYEKV